jgi:gamma-glutamyltranspeptidase / glutathione hydrolase
MPKTNFAGRAALVLAALAPLAPGAAAQVVESRHGMVVSASAPAADAGAAILAAGGNAVDAAVATAFAMAVTYPGAGNIGGGGFMVIRLADGRATTIDYRERAPGKATSTMYVGADGTIDRKLKHDSYLAVGVPGTVRGLALAHQKYGKLPWKLLVEPAVRLAREGFELTADMATDLNGMVGRYRQRYPATGAAYGKPGGAEWSAGDTLRLPLLAKTLQAIADQGPDAFYQGWIADRIAADMAAHDGLITKRDLANYRAVERPPVRGAFLGYEVIGMPPPSSGGIAILEALHILERFDIGHRPRYAPETLHLIIEAMRRAFLDRAQYLGDTDFGPVPIAKLTSPAHAREMASTIDTTRASSSVALAHGRFPIDEHESTQTTHFSVVDGDGNAVSNTYTLEQWYGSGIVVDGAGFFLNNEMGDFNGKPGLTNLQGDIGTPPNTIAPGKRMLSSMSPTIVTRNGTLFLVTGSPGGRTIINTVLEIVLNATAFGMDVRQAVDAPRFHNQWLPDLTLFEADGLPDSTAAALRAMGHTIRTYARQGDGHSIMFDPATGVARGANDQRSSDSKASAP